MKKQLFVGVAFAALAASLGAPDDALAQSSGTIAAEEEIVVTGARGPQAIEGVQLPDTPKARTVLTNEYLRTQNPGQSVIASLNIVPSVNFTNTDPFGSSGGNIRIRGFDGNRISLTFDGLPLNDTGNYAIFSNQQLDPEIIDSVNVNQGTTDVDSPTAASSGGTINYRTIVPSLEYGALAVGSYGQSYNNRDFSRVFGMVQSGEIFGTGIRGFITASSARNDKFRGVGEIAKEQYNARLYKVLNESTGDFLSLAGNFNRNRNNQYRSLTLAQAQQDFASNGRFTYDNNGVCLRPTFVRGTAQSEGATAQPFQTVPGVAENSCTNFYGVRINPSDTGNVRFNSKFTIADGVVFNLDAGYQYVLANGGGFTTLGESSIQARAGVTLPGVDYSGDGDTLDTVAFYTPNTTNTNRYTVLSSLRWDFAEDQYVRLAYAFDYGRHRQTGEWTTLAADGQPANVFGGRGGAPRVFDANGYYLRQRDRFSIAELNQVAGEYRGKFLDGKVEVLLGVRAPFFHRQLNNFCYTQANNGFALCSSAQFGTTPVTAAQGFYIIPNTTVFTGAVPGNALYAPFRASYNYRKILPNLGVTLRPIDRVQVFAGYAKGLSAPRTDNLYRQAFTNVAPETTDNFDVGIRYADSDIQASVGAFYNKFQNRIVTAFDQEQGISTDRNVGRVELKGLEASIDVRPFDFLSFRGFASYIDAKLKDNVAISSTVNLPLIGKKLVETPEYQYGYRATFRYEGASLGLQFKHVTSRFATDLNDVRVPGYSTFDIDTRVSLKGFGLEKTFIQFNVSNVFDEQYLGSINSQSSLATNAAGLVPGLATTASLGGANPTFSPGSPRAAILSLQIGF